MENSNGIHIDVHFHNNDTLQASSDAGVLGVIRDIPKYTFELMKVLEGDIVEHRLTPSPLDLRASEAEGFEYIATHECGRV